MRAPRDLLRRRMPRMRKRAELLAPIQQPHSQDNLPEIHQKLADKANRGGVAERFPEPAVHKSIAVALTLIDSYDRLLTSLELALVTTAKAHDAQTFSRLRSSPGIGQLLALVLRYESHNIRRFPRVQDFVSSCQLVTCATASAGKRSGTSDNKSGTAYLQWAFSEAAVRFLRTTPAGQKYRARLENKHGKGQALTRLAHN